MPASFELPLFVITQEGTRNASMPTEDTKNTDVVRWKQPEVRPTAEPPPALPVTMPASEERAARDIKSIGVEGSPADARAGPGMLLIEMTAIVLGMLFLATLIGVLFGWGVGLAMGVIAMLGVLMNPVFGATVLRVRDRKIAADKESLENSQAAEDERDALNDTHLKKDPTLGNARTERHDEGGM